MKVYFACSITGGRQDSPIYEKLVKALLEDGHEVPTAEIAGTQFRMLDDDDAVKVYTRDVDWIRECDALVAEVTTPSHGVGYEVAYALSHGKPVLCLAGQGAAISKMLTGNTEPGFKYAAYSTVAEGVSLMQTFLAALV